MRIVFYSTNSNVFDEETFKINVMPQNTMAFKALKAAHPEHEFFCITQKPAIFMPEDIDVIKAKTDTDTFAQKIAELKPDFAIAMTFWISPYDWLPVSDALVAEKLEQNGIKTICHSVSTGLNSFDKWRTHSELKRLGFQVPNAVFCDHDLYFCAGSNKEVLRNIYRESVISQIKKLHLPLIIKNTTGLSSYGMTVVHTYGEAACYLNSKRNNSNRLIEEFISGRQFGLEIYGLPGAYQILPPFEFSVNQYGITSPKQSIKYGPFELPEKLKKMMLSLAEKMAFSGVAQIDLILDDSGNWHIIEINPRLSGMSFTYAATYGFSIFELLYKTCIKKELLPLSSPFVMSLKLPLMEKTQMQEIMKIEGVKLLNQTNDLAAKQEREKGFCECIITADNKSVLQKAVEKFEKLFPEDEIVQSILKSDLFKNLQNHRLD